MKIKQLTFTNVMKEGRTIERSLGDLSKDEMVAFSNITDAFAIVEERYIAFDYIKGNICIFSKTSPFGNDSANRDRNYTHGYVFSGADCDEVMKRYPYLLGINYFAETMEAPLVDVNTVTSKFVEKLDFDDISVFLECVLEALFAKKTLEIRTDEPDRELFIRKVMNSIYEYIPVSLRKFITFSSHISNIRRALVATDRFTSNADLTYDYTSESASGLSGKYRNISARLASNGEVFVAELEKNIGIYCSSELPKEDKINSLLQNIEMAERKAQDISASDVIDRIIEAINRKKYNADAEYIVKLLNVIVKEKVKTSDFLEKNLSEIYGKTSSQELKDAISDYIVAKRSDALNTDFDFVFKLNKTDSDLFTSVVKKLIDRRNTEFLKSCVKFVNQNPSFGDFIVLKCGDVYADSVAQIYMDVLRLNEKRKEFFDIIIKNKLHPFVVKHMLLCGDTDILWDYECVVYSSVENIMACDALDRNLTEQCEAVLHSEISKPVRDGMAFIKTVYEKLGSNIYSFFEKKLIENNNQKLLEEFYSSYIAQKCVKCVDFNNLKDKMNTLGLKTSEFVQKNLDRYSEACIKETLAQDEPIILAVKRIEAFAEGVTISTEAVDKIKEEFWGCFTWAKFSFSFTDARIMKLQGNPKSIIANNLLNLSDYIKGAISEIDEDELKACKDALCYDNPNLTLKERDTIITKLRYEVNENVKCNTETKLLLSYSNKSRSLNLKKTDLSSEELSEYIKWCEMHSSCMLKVDGVLDCLYQYALKKYREENIADFFVVVSALKKFKENISLNSDNNTKKLAPHEIVGKILPSFILLLLTLATFICGKLLSNVLVRFLSCGIIFGLGFSFMYFMYAIKKKEKSIPFLAESLFLILNYIVFFIYNF